MRQRHGLRFQLILSDPDAGTSNYTYAADGTLLTQTDGRGIKTTYNYDNLRRLTSARIGQKTIAYTYGTTGNEKLRLTKMAVDNNSVEYTHDRFGRVVTEKRNVYGYGTYSFSYAYNSDNLLSKTTYPGGVEVSYLYDNYGFKSQSAIDDKVIYKVESTDGLVSSTSFMGKLTATHTRDSRGYESNRQIAHGSSILENFDESYDGATDNLLSRKRNDNLQETFGYDNLDRLVSVKNGTTETMKLSYAPNGNILFKTGVGNFAYDNDVRPHAVAEVENVDGTIPDDALATSFNDFGKVQLIEDAGKDLRMDFVYGPDQQRWYSELSHEGTDVRTTIYAGEYEVMTENGGTREFYYLDGNTIAIKEDGVVKYYLAFTDNLGSILSVMDENGTKVFDASYDVWGKQTVTLNTIGLHRGYTGHEMLNEFDIINMNGRLYDPVLGRFFSPDNYVQMPDNSQNFNRYSYCLNNPLKYVDPDGDFFFSALLPGIGTFIDAACWGTVIGGAGYTASIAFSDGGFSNWNWGQFGKSVGFGAVSGVVTAGVGQAFRAVGSNGIMGEVSRAFTHGVANGMITGIQGGDPLTGFFSGGLSSLASSAFMMYGGSFANSQTGNYAFSGLAGGVGSALAGGNFWEGTAIGLMNAGLNHLAAIVVRPSFNDLLANFPMDESGGEMPSSDVYELIGGKVLEARLNDPDAYDNACALRVSRALNGCGVNLPNIPGKTMKGADGKYYFYRAKDLYNWMYQSYGKPTSTTNYSSLSGNKGVYIMQANYPARFGAWGHATLYNLTGTIGKSYAGPNAYRYNLWGF